ncbi:hypothetical protein KPZU09_06520 [Klebsiella pneumoniae]|uniref:Uncharacterized protein n=1 Tax=Klebsiella pneumoniae TaxID=573 RepID=A0A919HL65_KLEPN|nr:hypothetical protein KPZU09_06520 [Klebsiella pneumoniae]
MLPPLGGEMQCGRRGPVPQSFRPAFRWRVSDVVLMGRARHVDLFAQPDEEDARRVEQALAQLGIAARPKMTSAPSPAASSSWC